MLFYARSFKKHKTKIHSLKIQNMLLEVTNRLSSTPNQTDHMENIRLLREVHKNH